MIEIALGNHILSVAKIINIITLSTVYDQASQNNIFSCLHGSKSTGKE